MNIIRLSLFAWVLSLGFQSEVQADSKFKGAYLDPPRKFHHHPVINRSRSRENSIKSSDLQKSMEIQSPVRSQAARGTCSIFSATALTEAWLTRYFKVNPKTVDLSEEFLEYQVNQNAQGDGSYAPKNLAAILDNGMPTESDLPYIGETWKSVGQTSLSRERCGHVPASLQTSCLIVHRDPRLLDGTIDDNMDSKSSAYDPELGRARAHAQEFKASFLDGKAEQVTLRNTDQIRRAILQGIPVILEVDFFYGAWNHRKGDGLGIPTNAQNFSAGWVGYPDQRSADYSISSKPENRSGHSILIVGYDDNYEIKVPHVKMQDGSFKDFAYKGAYIFKNSWGTDVFGSAFQAPSGRYPGYGAITYAYAHDYGTFDALVPVK